MSERSLRPPVAPVAPARAAAVLLGALATLTPPGGAQAAGPSPPSPRLRLSWAVSTHRCWTATERVRVRRGKKVTIHKRRVRRCGQRPTRVRGRDLHLRWRQTGEAFGHLAVAKQPIAGAQVTLSWTIPGWQSGTNVITTDAHGRFRIVIPGPSKILTISYSPAPGQLIAVTKRVAGPGRTPRAASSHATSREPTPGSRRAGRRDGRSTGIRIGR